MERADDTRRRTVHIRGRIHALLLAWVLGIVIVSLVPSGGVSLWNVDKVGHFLAYAGLATLICLSFESGRSRVGLAIAAVVLGAVLEMLQQFVPGRDMSVIDGVVNALGVLAGLVYFRVYGQPLRRWASRSDG